MLKKKQKKPNQNKQTKNPQQNNKVAFASELFVFKGNLVGTKTEGDFPTNTGP